MVDALPNGLLEGAVVGGDALYADTSLVRQLVQEHGAITLVQRKDNQLTAAARAEKLLTQQAPFFSPPHSNPATAGSTSATSAPAP